MAKEKLVPPAKLVESTDNLRNVEFLSELHEKYRSLEFPFNASDLGVDWFQENQLLSQLMQLYGGDSQRAFDDLFAYSIDAFSNPSNESLPYCDIGQDIYEEEFLESVRVIEEGMRAEQEAKAGEENMDNIQKMKASHRVFGKGYSGRHRRTKRGTIKNLRDKISKQKRFSKQSQKKEARFLERSENLGYVEVVRNINKGDTVIVLGDINHPFLASLVLGEIGRDGQMIVGSKVGDIEERLYYGMSRIFFDPMEAKGMDFRDRRKSAEKQRRGQKQYIKSWLCEVMQEYFAQDARTTSWYHQEDHLPNPNIYRDFYLYWGIVPLAMSGYETVTKAKASSINFIISVDELRYQDPKAIREFVYFAYNALTVGGLLVLRDGAFEHALVASEALNMFGDNFQKVKNLNPRHKFGWLVIRKNG